MLAMLAGASACQGPEPFIRPLSVAVRCNVERQECGQKDMTTGECLFMLADNKVFTGDICVDIGFFGSDTQAACDSTFCTPGVDAPGFCKATAVFNPFEDTLGMCVVAPAGSPRASVTGRLHSETCPRGAETINGKLVCSFLPQDFPFPAEGGPPLCLDLTQMPAFSQVGPRSDDIARATSFTTMAIGDPACTAAAPTSTAAFALTPGTMGVGSGAGVTATLSALRGRAVLGEICNGEICVLKTLDGFQADLADMTISGVQLTSLSVATVGSAPLTSIADPAGGTFLGVAAEELQIRVTGRMNGVGNVFFATNRDPFRVEVTSTFRLRGTLALDGLGPNGSSLPITVAVDASGTPATPQDNACASQPSLTRLFGFEDVLPWTSSQAALSLATTPVTQGCGALAVRGQGYMTIAGGTFTTRGLATNVAASVDLFIPGHQPNPFWLGALQMYLTCPSGNVFNQYIGQVELTGKPQNRYSTLRFPLPSATRSTLAQPLDDCAFSFGLNVNQTGQAWLLDNLRFSP
jgi:hypothetical protein